ncbi:ATP-binding protein [Devosia sp. A369]
MGIPTVFDLCEPRADILGGGIADSEYAANLANVLTGKASQDYLDPDLFFSNSYPTVGLKQLLTNVCGRLSGRGESVSAVFRLDTAYGGGKTHGLIALVHAARGMLGVANTSEFLSPSLLPTGSVRIAAFDGENADPANGRLMGDGIRAKTPWGEIAYQLAGKAGYEIIRASDEMVVAPGASTIAELFGNEPVLVVLDEMGEYLRRVQFMNGREQFTAFLKSLFSAIESHPNAALVYTLAVRRDGVAIDAFSAENQFLVSAMAELESVSGRKATNLNPTKDDETAKVIRRRLFGRVDDEGAAQVIEAYRVVWTQHRDALPDLARRSETLADFANTYPFHPDVFDTLTGKTATLSGFQRVRGMLRILGRAVAGVWADRPQDATAIHLHHIDLGKEGVRAEFTTRLQQDAYVPAILNDISGTPQSPSLAEDIDAKNYKGMLPYGRYVATTVFIHTLAFNNDLKGLTPDQLRYSVLSPEADISFIDDARTKFRTDSAYLDDRPNAPLRFNAEANLTQVIAREERNVDPETARTELRDHIREIFTGPSSSFDLIPFPAGPWDVPDDVADGKPKLALISHDALEIGTDLAEVPELVTKIYDHKGSDGSGLRGLKNNLVFLVADQQKVVEMKQAMLRRLALEELKRPDRLAELAEHQQSKVLELQQKSKTELAIAVQQAYRHVLYPSRHPLGGPGTPQLAHSAIDIQGASERPGSGQVQVVRQLKDQTKLREAADAPDSPTYIRDRTPLKKGQITSATLRAEFRRDPSLPILLSDDVLRKAIRMGIEDGTYIYQKGDLIAGAGDPLPSISIDEETNIYTVDFAKAKGLWPRQQKAQHYPSVSGGSVSVSSPLFQPSPEFVIESVPSSPVEEDPGTAPVAVDIRSFTAQGVLKEALKQVLDQAKNAKVLKIDRISVRLFEAGDGFKLVPVANTITGAKKTVKLIGEFTTTQDSAMSFEFEGTAQDASTMKDYLEPQFRAAKEQDLKTTLTFDFDPGLSLDGDDGDKFVDKLTRFASAAAYVEATAEVV